MSALPRSDTGEVAELLREVLARLDTLTAEVRELRAAPPSRERLDEADAELVHCLYAAFEGAPFFTWEIVDAASQPGGEELLAALGGLSPKRLGKRLRRLENVDLAGLRLVRIADSRAGAIRAVAPVR